MYVIIENWENLDNPYLLTDTDGNVLKFTSVEEAELEAQSCQEPIIVPLVPNLAEVYELIYKLQIR